MKQQHKDRVVTISSVLIIVGLGLFLAANFFASGQFTNMAFNQVGGLLLITGLFTLIYEYKIRQIFIQDMRHEIRDSLKYFLDSSSDFQNSGLTAYYKSLPEAEIYEEFKKATSILILQTWTGTDASIVGPLRVAAKNGCEIKILLLNPASDFAKERSKALGFEDPTYVPSQIETNLALFKAIADEFKEKKKIEIKVYDATPTIPIYICDENVYFGHIWRGVGKFSIITPYFKAKKFLAGSQSESTFWELTNEHFTDIWKNRSKPYAGRPNAESLDAQLTRPKKINEVGQLPENQ